MPRYKRKNPKPSKNLRKMVSQLIQKDKELHRINGVTTQYSLSTAGTTIDMADITAGDGLANRTGHEIFLQSYYARYHLVAGDATNIIRMIVYSKRDESSPDMNIVYNGIPDKDQFVIYDDKSCIVATDKPETCVLSYKFKGKGKKVTYDNLLGSSPVSGNLKMFWCSDSTTVAHPVMDGHFLTYFKE